METRLSIRTRVPSSVMRSVLGLSFGLVPMNRADPFFERDATGWQFIDMKSGRVAMEYNLYNNTNRVVAYDAKLGKPVDSAFQDAANRVEPQTHY